MRILALLIAALIASTLIHAVAVGDVKIGEKHDPKYVNAFTRFYSKNQTAIATYNFTINYSKTPKILVGVTPTLVRPGDLQKDVIRNAGNVRLDPRTCPNDVAYCYQVRENNASMAPPNLDRGNNYSALSSYALPQSRIKTYVCVGNDTGCISQSTNCFCPKQEVPPPPYVWGRGKCDDARHLCLDTYGSFKICEGNLSFCQTQHVKCGCGRQSVCVSQRNTCLNERNELVICAGGLADCLGKYTTCFCGQGMLQLQEGCTTKNHVCSRANRTTICHGSLADCALKFDKCNC